MFVQWWLERSPCHHSSLRFVFVDDRFFSSVWLFEPGWCYQNFVERSQPFLWQEKVTALCLAGDNRSVRYARSQTLQFGATRRQTNKTMRTNNNSCNTTYYTTKHTTETVVILWKSWRWHSCISRSAADEINGLLISRVKEKFTNLNARRRSRSMPLTSNNKCCWSSRRNFFVWPSTTVASTCSWTTACMFSWPCKPSPSGNTRNPSPYASGKRREIGRAPSKCTHQTIQNRLVLNSRVPHFHQNIDQHNPKYSYICLDWHSFPFLNRPTRPLSWHQSTSCRSWAQQSLGRCGS